LQKFRSSDNSFDSEKQKESALSAQSAPEKLVSDELQATSDEMQAALSSALLSEASLLYSCTPENKESASSAQSAPKNLVSDELQATSDEMQAAHLAFISPESEATISAYLPLSPKEFSPSCTPKKTLLHSCTLLNSSK
jgi:hypothetical protein